MGRARNATNSGDKLRKIKLVFGCKKQILLTCMLSIILYSQLLQGLFQRQGTFPPGLGRIRVSYALRWTRAAQRKSGLQIKNIRCVHELNISMTSNHMQNRRSSHSKDCSLDFCLRAVNACQRFARRVQNHPNVSLANYSQQLPGFCLRQT